MTDVSVAYSPPEIQSILGVIDTHLRWDNKQDVSRKFNQYHPSSFGHCLRNMQYSRYVSMGLIKANPEELESKSIRLFGKGHNMHKRWSQYFEDIGILRGVWQCKNICCRMWEDGGNFSEMANNDLHANDMPVSRIYGKDEKLGIFKPKICACGCKDFEYHELSVFSEEMNMYGHVDAVLDFSNFDPSKYSEVKSTFNIDNLPKSPIVVDMKTINDYRYKQKLMRSGPGLEYKIQLCIYANILDLDYGLLIYENKNDSEAKAFKVEKNTDTMFAEIYRQAKMMNSMASCSPPKLPPPRPVDKADYECGNCSFKSICHASAIWNDGSKLDVQRKQFYGMLLEQ